MSLVRMFFFKSRFESDQAKLSEMVPELCTFILRGIEVLSLVKVKSELENILNECLFFLLFLFFPDNSISAAGFTVALIEQDADTEKLRGGLFAKDTDTKNIARKKINKF